MLRNIWNLLRLKKPTPTQKSHPRNSSQEASKAASRGRGGRDGRRVPHPSQLSISHDKLDADAVKITQRLTRHEHEAYLVGGCVRDLLLGRSPKDFDIGTSATPRQVKRLFRNSRIIGRRFRLAHIFFAGGKIIEVATFRAKSEDNDNGDDASDSEDLLIRDDNLFGTAQQDALRRDFTINQLFYDVEKSKVIDYGKGLPDLKARLIRTIGEPEIRFREDPIRILRAIKFAARLDFQIEPGTLDGIRATRNELPKAAPPRVLEELNRFTRGASGRPAFELMRETGVLEVVLPEWNADLQREDTWTRATALLDALDQRQESDIEVSTGAILASLMLPILWHKLGWREGGQIEARRRGFQLRDIVEKLLRPVALRLRISRREQERARQLVGTLYRMLPDESLRGRARRSIEQRECIREAVCILQALGKLEGGEFANTAKRWRSLPKRTESEQSPARSRRRGGRAGRGRRGGRGSDRSREQGDEREQRPRRGRGGSSSNDRPQDRPRRGAPAGGADGKEWDFFAALPSVPQMAQDEGDRYGAGTFNEDGQEEQPPNEAAGDSQSPQSEGGSGEGERPTSAPRRRRRRRRPRGAKPASDSDSNDPKSD